MRAPRNSRVLREKRGRRAEAIAALWLRLMGYRILARRFRTNAGEIDIVAQRRRLLVFVEVKARPSRREALEALPVWQARRLVEAASTFLGQNPRFAEHDMRFDVIALTPGCLPLHLKDAWRPSDLTAR